MIKKIIYVAIIIFIFPLSAFADYPNTSIGVIDINKILSESKAAISASEQIEKNSY